MYRIHLLYKYIRIRTYIGWHRAKELTVTSSQKISVVSERSKTKDTLWLCRFYTTSQRKNTLSTTVHVAPNLGTVSISNTYIHRCTCIHVYTS